MSKVADELLHIKDFLSYKFCLFHAKLSALKYLLIKFFFPGGALFIFFSVVLFGRSTNIIM